MDLINNNKDFRQNSITVIMPSFNEEKNLDAAVRNVYQSVSSNFDDFEIIIFNDGSTDNTGKIADLISKKLHNVKVVHHSKPVCLGGVFWEGVKLARMEYLIRINGKNDISKENLDKIFSLRGKADLIVPYQVNDNERTLFRRLTSWFFTNSLNLLTGLKLKYYNHYVLHYTKDLRNIRLLTDSYAFQAQILIRLIKSGASYIEVGIESNFENDIKTSAFSLRNISGVFIFFFSLFRKNLISKFSVMNN